MDTPFPLSVYPKQDALLYSNKNNSHNRTLSEFLTRTIQERFQPTLNVFIDIRNILYQYLNRHVFLSHTEMFSLSFFHPGSYLVASLVFITLKRSCHTPQFTVKSINSYTLFLTNLFGKFFSTEPNFFQRNLKDNKFSATFLAQPKLFGLKLHVERVKTSQVHLLSSTHVLNTSKVKTTKRELKCNHSTYEPARRIRFITE